MLFKRIGDFFMDLLEVFVTSFAIFLFVYLLILQPHKIKGDSMEPNFHDGEYLLTDKLSYRFHLPQRGDVVVFKPPVSQDEEYIKRIIAIPGDRISIKNGKYFINGRELIEDYIPSNITTKNKVFLPADSEKTVPENSYFVSGDNREFSSDSRYWGFITKSEITGKAWVIYWPPKSIGLIKRGKLNLTEGLSSLQLCRVFEASAPYRQDSL
jgi:signal peptidase I